MSPARRHRRILPREPAWLLAGLGALLIVAGLSGFIRFASAASGAPGGSFTAATRTPFAAPPSPTPTPFRAQPPTSTPLPTTTPTPSPTPQRPHFAVRLVDGLGRPAQIRILPPADVGGGREIELSFAPASDCPFGNGTACISRHRSGQVILLTVHSGLTGQAEAFRRAVEGTGLDSAIFSLERIGANLTALQGAPVTLQVGADSLDGLELAAVARIPPARLEDYFNLPFDDALALAAQSDPAVAAALASGENLLVFEACGWVVPGEGWAPGVTSTTGSIYLGFIRDR